MKKAIVAGSFDPFTKGHLAIVKKAAAMFDEVTVIIGVNSNKKRYYDVESMRSAINDVLLNSGLVNCRAIDFEGPIAMYCKEHGIRYTVRGLRNNMDFHYENEITKINRLINADLETVYLPADNDAISSSMVREFLHYGIPVEEYVPREVMEVLKKEV